MSSRSGSDGWSRFISQLNNLTMDNTPRFAKRTFEKRPKEKASR
jgi:hypothetical protein